MTEKLNYDAEINSNDDLRVLKITAHKHRYSHKHSASRPDKPDADQANNTYVNKRLWSPDVSFKISFSCNAGL